MNKYYYGFRSVLLVYFINSFCCTCMPVIVCEYSPSAPSCNCFGGHCKKKKQFGD